MCEFQETAYAQRARFARIGRRAGSPRTRARGLSDRSPRTYRPNRSQAHGSARSSGPGLMNVSSSGLASELSPFPQSATATTAIVGEFKCPATIGSVGRIHAAAAPGARNPPITTRKSIISMNGPSPGEQRRDRATVQRRAPRTDCMGRRLYPRPFDLEQCFQLNPLDAPLRGTSVPGLPLPRVRQGRRPQLRPGAVFTELLPDPRSPFARMARFRA